MKRVHIGPSVWLAVTAFLFVAPASGGDRGIPADALQSGYAFQSPDSQALQDDRFANPGLLWVDAGKDLWRRDQGASSPACAHCHGDGDELVGVAARYPAYDESERRLVNLEQRINLCRRRHQNLAPLPYESQDLLSLSAFVASLSRGMPIEVEIAGHARPFFEQGRAYYYQRRGQLNLACNHCHERNWGKMLRGDRLSQGHGNGYPAYRFEWQTLGSLHRRLRFCNAGVRAEPLPYGAPDYVSLELFLAWRANGLPIETPAVRR